MTPREYRQMRKSMSLTCKELAELLGYKNRGSITNIECGRVIDASGHIPKRVALSLTSLKNQHDKGEAL